MKGVVASAPARVDLAGGTLDLWPIYLLHEGSRTVNFAIDRRARAEASPRGSGFEYLSRDLSFERRFQSVREALGEPRSRLAAEAALALGFSGGLRLEVESGVPFGSGLGGSSALLVAQVSALCLLAGQDLDADALVRLCRDLETRVLGVPAGTQDYEAALRGGFNVIAYGPGTVTVETSRVDVEAFSRHLVLFDSGEPHASGLNNWEIFRKRVDGDPDVSKSLDGVRDAAQEMARAAAAKDFEGMGLALARDWEARKRLSGRITTPTIAEAERRARDAGAWGLKACGAGGGGVLVALMPAERRAAVSAALAGMGRGRLFSALPDNEGLTLR